MYTAKLSLNPDNVEDVLAVAGFLQMQEIVSACNALKSLNVPAESPPESQPPPAAPGTEPPCVPSPREAGNHPGSGRALWPHPNPRIGCVKGVWMGFHPLVRSQKLTN